MSLAHLKATLCDDAERVAIKDPVFFRKALIFKNNKLCVVQQSTKGDSQIFFGCHLKQ